MGKEVFRKKSLEKVNSPEDLNSYLRVTSPSLLIALIAAIILIIGAIFWGTFAKIETRVKGVALKETSTCCYINANDIGGVVENKTYIRANNITYTVTHVNPDILLASEVMPDKKVRELGGFAAEDHVYKLDIDKEITAGYFSCDIVLKVVSPMEFLFKNY